MSTFVLVHGTWSGAHSFRHVRNHLQALGHQVFTPSLTGVGERSHLASPLVNLSTHILDVVNQVLYEDLEEITLVGFSYGGFVVTGALEHIADRVKHLVYLDAFVPVSGQTVLEHLHGIKRSPVTLGAMWSAPISTGEYDDPSEGQWVDSRRTPHPMGCFTEAVYIERDLEKYPFTRSYIKASANRPDDLNTDPLWRAASHASVSAHWRYYEIETTHLVSSNRPAELSKILNEISCSC